MQYRSCKLSGTDLYPHMPILRPHAARYIANVFKFHERRISRVKLTSAHVYGNVYMRVGVARALAVSSDFRLLEVQNCKVYQTIVIPLDADEPPSKCDAANFVYGGEIRIRTNTQKTNT